MKKQSFKDRMHEHEGMMRQRMHSSHGRAHGQYENEVEKPSVPHEGHMLSGWGMHDFKDEADPIAYGQAGMPGCKSDDKKMHSQFKDYHWD